MHAYNKDCSIKTFNLSQRLLWCKNHRCGLLSLITYCRYHLYSPDLLTHFWIYETIKIGVLLRPLSWLGFMINTPPKLLQTTRSISTGNKWGTLLYSTCSLND